MSSNRGPGGIQLSTQARTPLPFLIFQRIPSCSKWETDLMYFDIQEPLLGLEECRGLPPLKYLCLNHLAHMILAKIACQHTWRMQERLTSAILLIPRPPSDLGRLTTAQFIMFLEMDWEFEQALGESSFSFLSFFFIFFRGAGIGGIDRRRVI